MSNADDKHILIESLKLCVEAEMKSEKSFIRYSIVTIISIFLIIIAKSRETLKIPILGEISSSIVLENMVYIEIFLVLLMCYAITEWILCIINLNRHELYNHFSKKESLAAKVADKWDNHFCNKHLKMTAIFDLIQNLAFFLILFLLLFFLLKALLYAP